MESWRLEIVMEGTRLSLHSFLFECRMMRYTLHHRPNVTSCPPICCWETTNLRGPIPIVYKASVKLVLHSQILEQLTTTVVQCFKVSTWSHQLECDNQAISFEVLDQSVYLDPLMTHTTGSQGDGSWNKEKLGCKSSSLLAEQNSSSQSL
jgi:hypothetical protein